MVGAVMFNVLTFTAFLPLSIGSLLGERLHSALDDDRVLKVFFIFLPPVSSIILPYPRNDTFMFIGLDGFVLHMLCERLHRRAIVHTDTSLVELDAMYYGYTRFGQIREHHRRIYTKNEVSVMNSK